VMDRIRQRILTVGTLLRQRLEHNPFV
jgi:hypothetical protein